MFVEQHFANASRHKKEVNPEWELSVAEYLEKVGATDLDDPKAPRRKTPLTEAQVKAIKDLEQTKARKKAKREHKEALARLEDGTAVLRQARERTKPAATKKQLNIAKKPAKPAKKMARVVKPVVKKERKPYYHKPDRKVPSTQVRAKARRSDILDRLKAGEFIPMQPKKKSKGENIDLYHQQRTAVKKVEKDSGLLVLRVKRISDNKSFWTIDSFKRHKIERPITGRLDDEDRIPLITAVSSGELVLASDIKNGTRIGIASVTILARKHGMNIYAVFSGANVLGWILIDKDLP